jgi:hypothetical protein
MGVIGSHCQLCRLPLHHDHYVPDLAGSGMLKIYRTSRAGGGHDFAPDEQVVTFTPDHWWMCRAVAIPRSGDGVLRGTVEDGVLTDETTGKTAFIWEGEDEAVAYHAYCWELMGSPETDAAAITARGLLGWAIVDAYKGQLFEHHEFREHGYGWMLHNPAHPKGTRSRARIQALLDRARTRPTQQKPYSTVRELVQSDFGWAATMLRDDAYKPAHIIHYRSNLTSKLDCEEYPILVWAMKGYGESSLPAAETLQALVDYEARLIDAVEADDRAIVLMTTMGEGQTQYLVQARDEAVTRAVIDALPAPEGTDPVDYENESDPEWRVFFEKMNPKNH